LIWGKSVSMLTDHFLINIEISLQTQYESTITYWKDRSIDKDTFLVDFCVSSLVLEAPDDVDQLVDISVQLILCLHD
jgi:hypothetical protein